MLLIDAMSFCDLRRTTIPTWSFGISGSNTFWYFYFISTYSAPTGTRFFKSSWIYELCCWPLMTLRRFIIYLQRERETKKSYYRLSINMVIMKSYGKLLMFNFETAKKFYRTYQNSNITQHFRSKPVQWFLASQVTLVIPGSEFSTSSYIAMEQPFKFICHK